MNTSKLGGWLLATGIAVALIGFIQGSSAYSPDASTVGYYVGGWIGVGIAVVGLSVFMASPRP